MFKLPSATTFDEGQKTIKLFAAMAFGWFAGLFSIALTVLFAVLVIWYPAQRTLSTCVLAGSGMFAWVGCLSVLWALTGNHYRMSASRGGLDIESGPDDQSDHHQQQYAPPPYPSHDPCGDGPHVG